MGEMGLMGFFSSDWHWLNGPSDTGKYEITCDCVVSDNLQGPDTIGQIKPTEPLNPSSYPPKEWRKWKEVFTLCITLAETTVRSAFCKQDGETYLVTTIDCQTSRRETS